MSERTNTPPSKTTSPSPSDDHDIVELLPPASLGFSGTAKLSRKDQPALIDELQKRGYTVVRPEPLTK